MAWHLQGLRHAALLAAAGEHLGKLLVVLRAAIPSLAACGFEASFEKQMLLVVLQESRSAGALLEVFVGKEMQRPPQLQQLVRPWASTRKRYASF